MKKNYINLKWAAKKIRPFATTLKTVTLLLALACSNMLIAQNAEYEWATSFTGSDYMFTFGLAADDAGYVYTTGGIVGTVDFDPGSGTSNITSAGITDIYVSKQDPSGNLEWAKSFPGAGNNNGRGIAVDGSGNVYATGSFAGTADFDPGAGVNNISSQGQGDMYIAKFDPQGNLAWVKIIGGPQNEVGFDIHVDDANNIYITGEFSNTIDFDPGPGVSNLTGNVNGSSFALKLNSSGGFEWARAFGLGAGLAISTDGNSNVVLTGRFSGTGDFDPGAGTATMTAVGSFDIFIVKLNSLGNFDWAKQLGATGFNYGNGIGTDDQGNVFVGGYYYGTADFDPGAGTTNLTSNGTSDTYVVKFDATGAFQWAHSLGGAAADNGNDLSVDGAGNVYTIGAFRSSVDFDPGAGTNTLTSNAGSADVYISKLDGMGNFVWAKQIGGNANDFGYSMAINQSGDIFTSGVFGSVTDFDPGTGVSNITASGLYDGFVLKLSCSVDVSTTSTGNTITANQTGATYQWLDCDSNYTEIPGATNQSYIATSNGEYAVIVSSGGCIDTSDCVRVTSANVKDHSKANHYGLYPNPTTSLVTISNYSTSINKVSILSVRGQLLKSYVPNSASIDMSDFPKGLYIVRLRDGDKTVSQKLIKE